MCAPHLDAVPESQTRTRAGWRFAGLALLAVLFLGNLPLWTGKAAPQWDAVDFFGPAFSLLGDQVRSGHLAQWNPWTGGGVPDWAEPEFGTSSPVHLAAAFLTSQAQSGYIAFWMAVWCFGGFGMLLLARHLGAPPSGAAIAALGFAASGFYTGHAEHLSWEYAASFLPWVVWRLDAGLLRGDWWCAIQAGALYGLSALGAYPAFTIVTPGFLFLWTMGRVFPRGGGESAARPSPIRAAALLVASLACGAVILSPPYVGLVTAARGFSDRAGQRPREEATSNQMLAAGALTTAASPYLAELNLPPKPLWPATDVSLTSVYTGAASLILAAFALRRRSAWRWWLAGVAAFFLCCALGGQLPLRGWLYDSIPATRYFRHAALFSFYAIFIVAILAALGTRDLAGALVSNSPQNGAWVAATRAVAPVRRGPRPALCGPTARSRLLLWLLSLAGSIAAASVLFVVIRRAAKPVPQIHPAVEHLVLVWFGFAALAFLLWRGRMGGALFLRLAACLACLDAAGALYLSQPIMYSAATLDWWRAMNRQHSASLDLSRSGLEREAAPPEFLGAYPNNRNAVLKVPVFDGYSGFGNRFQERFAADAELSRMASGAQRVCFSSAAGWSAPDDSAFAGFEQRVHSLGGQPILLLHSPSQMRALTSRYAAPREASAKSLDLSPCLPVQAADVVYHPDSLAFRITAPAHGYLLVTDRWAPGWEAAVNGQSREVLGGDFIFRAVEVEAGVNRIEFKYRPAGFDLLLAASWGMLFLIGVGQFRRWIQAHSAGRIMSRWRHPALFHPAEPRGSWLASRSSWR